MATMKKPPGYARDTAKMKPGQVNRYDRDIRRTQQLHGADRKAATLAAGGTPGARKPMASGGDGRVNPNMGGGDGRINPNPQPWAPNAQDLFSQISSLDSSQIDPGMRAPGLLTGGMPSRNTGPAPMPEGGMMMPSLANAFAGRQPWAPQRSRTSSLGIGLDGQRIKL